MAYLDKYPTGVLVDCNDDTQEHVEGQRMKTWIPIRSSDTAVQQSHYNNHNQSTHYVPKDKNHAHEHRLPHKNQNRSTHFAVKDKHHAHEHRLPHKHRLHGNDNGHLPRHYRRNPSNITLGYHSVYETAFRDGYYEGYQDAMNRFKK